MTMKQRIIEELQEEAGEGGTITIRREPGTRIHEGMTYRAYRGEELLAKEYTLKGVKAAAM